MVDSVKSSEALTRAGRWDRAGVIVSAACAVHCTLLPFVAGLIPILGLRHFADERVEWLIIATTAVIGVIGHTQSYVRHHGHAGPGLLFLVGLGLVVVIRLNRTEGLLEPIALGFGGLLASAAHWANMRLCRCCGECGATHQAPSAPPSRTPPA